MYKFFLRSLTVILFLIIGIFGMMCSQEPKLEYPVSRAGDIVDDYFGTYVADPYRWLEDTDSEETAAWVRAQNMVTFGYLERIPEKVRISERMTELWDYEKLFTPHYEGGWYFYKKNDGLQNQSVLFRRKKLDSESEIVLDPNGLSEDGTVALKSYEVSKDGKIMMYATSASGSDWQEFYFRDLDSGNNLSDHLTWIKFSGGSWARDNSGIYYCRYPVPTEGEALLESNRNQKVYFHKIGTDQSEDMLVYERPDQPDWGYDPEITEDGRYLVMHVWHGTDPKNRVHYMRLSSGRKKSRITRLLDDFDASYSFVGNDNNIFYFQTDLNASRGRLIAIDVNRPAKEHWREIIPEQEIVLENVTIVNNKFCTIYLQDAHSIIKIYNKDGSLFTDVSLPALGSVSDFNGRTEGTELFYSFTSFTYPETIFRYDFNIGQSDVYFTPEVDFDPSEYESKQVFYTSKDGTRIPMFLTYKKGLELSGNNPVYLYGYGGFNISETPDFRVRNIVWLEMGGVYALANLRGGAEYGEEWHQQGILDRKQNVFDDFIAAAEYLIAEKYTSSEKLAIAGGSNGGLLVGACMTQRPELFGAALPAVGVMDMLRYHKFTIGWAWASDYGTSEDPDHFKFLYAYSPLHNFRDNVDYPATMVTTADHDDRVVPGHSFKFAAALQKAHAGSDPVLIRIETKAGHGAGKPTAKIIEEQSDKLAFLVKVLNIRY